jgi:hypothetical protein
LYVKGEIQPVDQNSFFDGDLQAEIKNGLKFNELRYTATHNSYQTESLDEFKKVFRNLSDLSFGLISEKTADFVSPTLTQQLERGIYSFEIDVEVFDEDGDVSFTCMHIPQIQMTTSCYDFELALKEIAMWSDNNPGHLPVTIIIEPKEIFIPMETMKPFSMKYADDFDALLRKGLGDKLFTPADMLGDYESFGAMRADDGWRKVEDMLGKVLILLHDCGTTEKYIESDPTMKTQAMFPMLRANDAKRDCASFLIINNPEKCDSEFFINEKKFIVRTRADEFTSVKEERRKKAFECGAQIISTDHPVREGVTEDDYVACFGDFKTISK